MVNSNIVTKDDIFQDENLHVSTYLAALDREYGQDYLFFEPETLQSELCPSEAVLDKIQAGITLKTTSAFWNDIVVFEKVALALNNRRVSFEEYQDLSPGEMTWAMVETRFIDSGESLGDDVKVYIAMRLRDEGYTLVPQDIEYDRRAVGTPVPPQGVQEQLDKLTASPHVIDRHVQQSRLNVIETYTEQHLMAIIGEMTRLSLY